MNIIEAYIKYKGQLLLLISGLSGCGKLNLGKELADIFNITLIDEFNYYKKNYNEKIKLSNGDEIINWYTDDAIDWDRFNKDIDREKKNGVIVIGFSLPEDKIESSSDYHIHLNIPKQVCLEKRKIFLEKHKDTYPDEYKLSGSDTEKLKMNKLIFPYYLESTKKSKINRFVNVGLSDDSDIYDKVFDMIIEFINEFLYGNNFVNSDSKTPKVSRVTHQSDTDSISISSTLLDEPEPLYDKNLDMITLLSSEDDEDDDDIIGPLTVF